MNPSRSKSCFSIRCNARILAAVLAQADMFEGQPTFSQGAELGYYIWKEGDKWKVRWTRWGLNENSRVQW